MSGNENILVGLLAFLPAVLIFVVVAILAATRLKQRDAASGKKYAQSSGGVQNYTPKEYSREVKEIHQTDPGEDYRHQIEQLRALFQNGMMDRGEFEDRKAEIEWDYRQGFRAR